MNIFNAEQLSQVKKKKKNFFLNLPVVADDGPAFG